MKEPAILETPSESPQIEQITVKNNSVIGKDRVKIRGENFIKKIQLFALFLIVIFCSLLGLKLFIDINFFFVGSLLNSFLGLLFGIIIYLNNRESKLHWQWMIFSLCYSLWSFGLGMMAASNDKEFGLFWGRVLFAGAIFIPITYVHFILLFLNKDKQYAKLLRLCYLISAFFFFSNFTKYFVADVRPILSFAYWTKAGILTYPFTLMVIGLIVFAVVELVKSYFKAIGTFRSQIQYLLFAMIIGYGGGITNFLPTYDILIHPYGNYFVPFHFFIISYAIVKYRLMGSDFAFVIHTTDINLLGIALNMPWLSKIPKSLLKKIFMWLPPFKCSHITGVSSLTGRKIEGDLIFCPLLPEQILNLDQSFVLKKIIKAGEIAKENGAKILGLGAYTAQVGKRGVLVSKELNMPVTTGSSYTAAVTMDAIFEAAKKVCINLSESKAAVIGATGGIGKVCSQILSVHVPHIVLIARNQERLNNLAKLIQEKNNTINIETTTNISKETISDCDIIIIVTNDPMLLIDIKAVKSGAVICDVSQPPNISKQDRESRNDILIIDGGIVKPHGNVNFNFYFGLPPGLAFACMAETMILALEEKYEPYSIGGNITLEKVLEISKLAAKHGFMLSDLKSSGKQVLTKEIDSIRKYIQTKYSYA